MRTGIDEILPLVPDWSRELAIATAAARAAGDAALGYVGAGPRVTWKADDSPVSEADRAAEVAVLAHLRRSCPDDGVLSEESGEHPGASGRRWIVDPVDGTRAFLRGLPFWCVLVALEAGCEVVVGVMYLPMLGRTYSAARGHGAWRNGARLAVADRGDVARSALVLGELRSISRTLGAEGFGRLVGAVGSAHGYGAGYGAALLLEGQADAWLECDVSPWDVAPFGVLFEEAGARCTDLDGQRRWPTRSALAAPPGLHEALLPLVSSRA